MKCTLVLRLASWTLPAFMAAVVSAQAGDGGNKLEGAWIVHLSIDSSSSPEISAPPTEVMAFFTAGGAFHIDNVVPDPPGVRTKDGTGEWVRSGNRQFDLIWKYVVSSAVDGSPIGMFTDTARLQLSTDGAQLSGSFTFEVALRDGSVPLRGTGHVQATRIRAPAP